MRKLKVSLALVLLAIATAACSVDGNITDMTVRKTTSTYSQLTGIVPGAGTQTTVGGYYIEASIGNQFSSIRTTTVGGYEVYSNIQGNMATDGVSSVTIE